MRCLLLPLVVLNKPMKGRCKGSKRRGYMLKIILDKRENQLLTKRNWKRNWKIQQKQPTKAKFSKLSKNHKNKLKLKITKSYNPQPLKPKKP